MKGPPGYIVPHIKYIYRYFHFIWVVLVTPYGLMSQTKYFHISDVTYVNVRFNKQLFNKPRFLKNA